MQPPPHIHLPASRRLLLKASAAFSPQQPAAEDADLAEDAGEDEDIEVIEDPDRLYTTDWLPNAYYGPVEVKLFKGKGRGLVLTQDVGAGELLLVCKPMSVVFGKAGKYLSPERLVKNIVSFTDQAEDEVWLTLLYDGTPATAARLFDLHDFEYEVEELDDDDEREGEASAVVAGEAAEELVVEEETVTPERVRRIVELNCFGEDYSDPAAAATRSEAPRAFLGLWPEFALLNHSCMPNACMVVLDGTMLVRAAAPLRRGTEVTINYAGDLVAAPRAVRHAHLRTTFGFECQCLRCAAEQQVSPQLQTTVQEAYTALTGDLKPRLLAALEADNARAVASVAEELKALEDRVEAALAAALGGKLPLVEQMLRAGVYQMYELQSMCADYTSGGGVGAAAGGRAPGGAELVERRLAILKMFASGTYNYAWLTAEWLRRAEGGGAGGERVAAATRACAEAHVARYGPIGSEVFKKLVAAHSDNALLKR